MKVKEEDIDRLSEFGDIDRLYGIQDEISDLVKEARDIVRNADGYGRIYERAKSYWIPHIITALSNDHDYLGGSMCTLEDTIEELKELLEEEYEEEEDYDE